MNLKSFNALKVQNGVIFTANWIKIINQEIKELEEMN